MSVVELRRKLSDREPLTMTPSQWSEWIWNLEDNEVIVLAELYSNPPPLLMLLPKMSREPLEAA